MKTNRELFLTILLFASLHTISQNQTGNNLYEFMINYYRDNPYPVGGDTNKRSGFAKDYDRTFTIWGPRLYPHGNFQVATNALTVFNHDFLSQNQSNQQYSSVIWSPLGPMGTDEQGVPEITGIGQIHRITFDPQYNGTTNQTIYAASFYGGLWKTTNDGDLWSIVNTDLQLPITSVSDIALDFNNSNNLFISTGMGDGGLAFRSNPNWGIINPISTSGIYRSTNGGINWNPINNGFIDFFQTTGTSRRMILNPQNSNQIFVATSAGIFRSNNALNIEPVWQRLTQGIDTNDTEYRGLEFQPGHPSTLYTSGKDIYRSIDGGNSWQSITSPYGLKLDSLAKCEVNRINLAVTPADSTRLYAYIEGTYICPYKPDCRVAQIAYIYMFKNNTWTLLNVVDCHRADHTSNPWTQLSPDWLGFAASPVNANQLFFGYTIVKGCRNVLATPPIWNSEGEYSAKGLHPDCHALVFQPNVQIEPKLFAGTHGGISVHEVKVSGYTRNWTRKYSGLDVSMIWSFDVGTIYKDYFILGFQCNGTKIRHLTNFTSKWSSIIGGDGYGAQIGYQQERISFIDVNDQFYRHEYSPDSLVFVENDSQTHFLPIDPVSQSTVNLPKTFQVKKHISEDNPVFGFSELFERKKKRPYDPGDTLWKAQSDIYKYNSNPDLRQITEFAIAPSNKNYIYIVIGGQIDPSWGIVPPQLYRSTSGGNNGNYSIDKFVKLTDSLPIIPGDTIIYHPIITGIAIHPNDPNKIWICFTGYYPSLKVYYSSNRGKSWSNYDSMGSLPNLPINGIVYQEGTNDRLYIATDAGVYVKNSPTSDWARYGNIPNVRVTELKINPCTGKLCAATFGRGLWETDLLSTNNVYQEIDTTETWSNDRILENSFIVKSPNSLTVTGTLYMPKDSRIIVEPGALLILDGGRVTQNCGYLWKGIELWGDRGLSQIPVSNQGRIQILNDGTIENAEIAILAGKRLNDDSGFDPDKAGGMVWCTNGNFINNKVAVLFTPYTYYNRSYFRNTDFLTNSILNDLAQPDCFIKAFGVADVSVYGCSFKNVLNWNSVPVTERGTGIYCDNSRVFVLDGCLLNEEPCNHILPSSFEMLSRGVYSMNNGSITYAYIKNANFYDNVKGLYISGSSGASHSSIINNNFRVFRPGEENIDCYGMYLNECASYQVEENKFYSEGSFSDGIGLVVNNSIVEDPAEINQIYKNTFTNLMYATIAQNINRNPVTREGLCYKCNKFFDNSSDISVTKDPNLTTTRSFGIAENQGAAPVPLTQRDPAGNMFGITPLTNHLDINNELAAFNYYYHNVLPQQYRFKPDYSNGPITPFPVSVGFEENIACPPSATVGGGSNEDQEEMESSAAKADSLNLILATLVDGGSTETLNNEVLTSTPSEALATHDELLAHSPYVSDTVIGTAIGKENVLNNAMVRDIMVANPQSAKSEILVDMLENRIVPMPDYLMAEILQGEDSISNKENLESQRAFWNAHRSQHYHNLIRHFRDDTITGLANDSLIGLLQFRNTVESWYDLTATYFQRGEYQTGLNILDLIPTSFSLNNNQQVIHQSYKSLYEILRKISTDSSSMMNLDSMDKIAIVAISTSNLGQVSAFARNLLIASKEINYSEPIFLPEIGLKSSKRDKYRGVKYRLDDNHLKVYPNPVMNYFIVEYNLEEIAQGCCIEITDIMGKSLKIIPIKTKEHQKVIPVNDLNQGVYIITLKNNGKSIQQAKLTLVR